MNDNHMWYKDPVFIVELFVIFNMTFLGFDIIIAHSANSFAQWTEWIPVIFSFTASFALVFTLVRKRSFGFLNHHYAGLIIGWLSVFVGIAGMIFHLNSQLFQVYTIKSLVYTAPFAAPLSYTGIGFLLLLNGSVAPNSKEWSTWVIFLALGGFFGNFILTLCDHAQNGFFSPSEWIPVWTSAFAVGFLTTIFIMNVTSSFMRLCSYVAVMQMATGFLGFYLHLTGLLAGNSRSFMDTIIYGPPIFAPLLLPNISLLALIGIWKHIDISGKNL